ncbi:unnamed protein product [Ascophyllum nodosum]
MHSVLITNREGKILLSRYFDTRQGSLPPLVAGVSENAAEFESGSDSGAASMIRDRAMAMRSSESEVLGQTRHLWTKGTAEYPQVARVKGGLIIVFGAVGDLLVFLCGCREYDELILADILAALAKIITTLCKQGNKGQTATEAALMSNSGTGSTYSKACLAIDEMLPGGILETLDVDTVLGAIKLQNPSTR